MEAIELLRIHTMAREFGELYRSTGLIGIGQDNVQLSLAEFYQAFGDQEYEYEGSEDYRAVQYKSPDGVTYRALLKYVTVREVTI